jgi:hypothetical protein
VKVAFQAVHKGQRDSGVTVQGSEIMVGLLDNGELPLL